MTDRPPGYMGMYFDDLAAAIKARGGGKYRPSNGTEGEIFQQHFCGHCKHDAATRREPPDWDNGCRILAMVFAVDVESADYPAEWRYGDDGQPECTAWEAE